MNFLDLFILLPIGFFAYKGFMAGLIKEVLGILGVILGVFAAFAFMKTFSVVTQPFFSNPDTATIVSGLIIFIATIGVVQLIGYFIRKFLQLIQLNFINRIAGLCFGALKSAIVISGFLWLFAGFNMPAEETRNESLTYPFILGIAPATFNMVATFYPGIESFIDTIEKAIDEENPIRSFPIFEDLKL